MNKIVNKFLLAGNKFMSEMHLKQPWFTDSACGPFTKNKERIQKFKVTIDISYIYKNELDKACFQHDVAYGHFKDFARTTASDKVLRDKAFNIAKNPKYDRYKRGISSMVYKFLDKKSKGGGVKIPLEFNEQLTEDLHKTIIRNLKKRTVYSGFNKRFRFLLCVIDIFSKYAWAVPLKDKKGVSIVDAFQKTLKESDRKPNKIWVDKRSEFYNNSFKKWLKDNDTEMSSINNEGKPVVSDRFIRTLKTKIYKYMTSVSINVTWLKIILKKLKIQFHRHMPLMISMVRKLLEHLMKKNYKRQINKNLE